MIPNLLDIQSTILKTHGRDFTFLLFISLDNDQEKSRNWISQKIYPKITSCGLQNKWSSIRRTDDPTFDGGTVINFFLTATGFSKLKIPISRIPDDVAFNSGMSSRKELKDEDYSQDYPIVDALIYLSDNKWENIQKEWEAIANYITLNKIGKVVEYEFGNRQEKGHFGYVDNISNPTFFELDEENKHQLIHDDLHLVLYPEHQNRFGSFLVFRRLEQNISTFENYAKLLAREISSNYEGNKLEFAKAQIMGRFPNGTPLTKYKITEDYEAKNEKFPAFLNEFDYSDDIEGNKCPFQAHVRRTNPRNDEPNSQNRRIVRRSVSYDYSKFRDLEKGRKGLLFMCFQKNIIEQFEFIQINLSNNLYKIKKDSSNNEQKIRIGLDLISGQKNYTSTRDLGTYKSSWNSNWNNPDNPINLHFNKFVTLIWGNYFYAPSISFIKYLNRGRGRI